jgi:oligoendopeptidase F
VNHVLNLPSRRDYFSSLLDGLLKQIKARDGPATPSKAVKPPSVIGAFFKPSERPLPSEPQAWDLSALYNDPSGIEADILRLGDRCVAFAETYRGRLAKLSGSDMVKCLSAYGEIGEIAGRVMSYLGLRSYSDTRDGEALQLMRKTQIRVGAVTEPLICLSLEITQLTDDRIAALVAEEPDLNRFVALLDQMRMLAPYQLTEEDELSLHRDAEQQNLLRQDFDNRMGTLQVELNYPSFDDETLGLEQALNRLTAPEAQVRKAALDGVSASLAARGDALFEISRGLIQSKAREDAKSGFSRPDASRLLSQQVEPEWIDTLMATVESGYQRTTHRYYELKGKWLGGTRLGYQDRNAPLPTNGPTFTYREAVGIVHETFVSLSPHLGQLVRQFFTSHWVDARPVEYRVPGAFAHPTVTSAHPFVHTHFYGGSRDVVNLSGMMGHGILQTLGQKNGPLLGSQPLCFSNAVASFFETLVTEHRMLCSPDGERPVLTAGFLEDRLNTIERQAMFFRFEQEMHRLVISGCDITVRDVNALWIAKQKDVLGPEVEVPEAAGWLWSYIPHFVQSPFTTVTYAFGGLLASVMYAAYLEEREAHSSRFVDRLLAAMEAGGTVSFAETVGILEIDPTVPTTWKTGVDVSAAIIDTLKGQNFEVRS